MPEEIVSSDAAIAAAVVEAPEAPAPAERFESPPVAGAPERREFDPRARLHELALELVRTQNRRLLVEYLRLRRAAS
jgi:hypothetical protein